MWVPTPGLSIPGVIMSFKGFLTSAFYALAQIFKCLVSSHSDLSLHATSEVSWLTKVATLPIHPHCHIVLFSSIFIYFCLAACVPLQGYEFCESRDLSILSNHSTVPGIC